MVNAEINEILEHMRRRANLPTEALMPGSDATVPESLDALAEMVGATPLDDDLSPLAEENSDV